MVNGRLRVRVAVGDMERAGALARLVAAAGHDVVIDGAEVVLADAAAVVADGPPVLVLGGVEDAGFAGVLPEAVSALVLDAGLRAVAAGLTVRPGGGGSGREFRAAEEVAGVLTPREVEVLTGVGAGLSNKEVARRLGISAHTVKFHLEAAFRKLGVRSRAEAVAKGLRRGLIEV